MVHLKKQIIGLILLALGGCHKGDRVNSPTNPPKKAEIRPFNSAENNVPAEELTAKPYVADRDYNYITVNNYGMDLTSGSYLSFTAGTANFESKADYDVIAEVATYLTDNPKVYIRVEGHTDADGDEQENYVLSLKRAETIGAWLKAYGVEGTRIAVSGCGEWYPRVSREKTKKDQQKNRRVEFVFVDSSGVSAQYEACMVGTTL
jgi:outer membrane protein OmpA-like peptidoglycan-associated protein